MEEGMVWEAQKKMNLRVDRRRAMTQIGAMKGTTARILGLRMLSVQQAKTSTPRKCKIQQGKDNDGSGRTCFTKGPQQKPMVSLPRYPLRLLMHYLQLKLPAEHRTNMEEENAITLGDTTCWDSSDYKLQYEEMDHLTDLLNQLLLTFHVHMQL